MAENQESLSQCCQAVANACLRGLSVVVVHGGGKNISRNLKWVDEEPHFINGLRATSQKAMDIVEMTLSGQVNKHLVRLHNQFFPEGDKKAIGISGVDGNLFLCQPISTELGQVGEITEVDSKWVKTILKQGGLPIVSPISVDKNGLAYNVNADEAARALAESLNVSKLIFISDVPGVLDGEKKLIASLNEAAIRELIEKDVISGGMVPKIKSCLSCLKNGVGEVHISGFSSRENLEKQLLGLEPQGTIISL